MTKSLKVKILAVLLTVLLAMGGLFLANTTKVNASVSTGEGNTLIVDSFVVHQGASIRLGNGTEEEMGIKFAAELSNEDYQELKAKFTSVQYGMFIMPKSYETDCGLINYDNCFGESRIYYGPEEFEELDDATGKYRIHNIPTVPKYVEEENGYNGYLVQGSIIKMKDANLNVELIGVGYIVAQKDGQTYYAFANEASNNVRTVVQTAQNMLEKEGFDNEDTTNQIVQGYVRRFLSKYEQDNNNQSFQASYNAEFYLRKANGDLVPVESKNTVVEGVEFPSSDIAKTVAANNAPAHDGYIALNGLNGAFNDANEFVYDSKLLKVDGSTTLQFIYEEDKGNMILNSSMINGSFGWSSPTASAIYDGWSMSGGYGLKLSSEQTLYYGTGLSSTVTKDEGGNHVYGQETTARNGWKVSNLVFPTTVKKFSFWCVNTGTASVTLNIAFNEADWGKDRVDKSHISRTIAVSNQVRKVEIEIANTYANGEIGSVNTIRFIPNKAGLIIDNFAWEKDLYVEQKMVKADSDTQTSLGNLKQNLKSTKYTAEELANVEVSNVTARALSSGTTALTEGNVVNNDGTYTLTGLESKGFYEYSATYTLGEEASTTGKGFIRPFSGSNMIASFDKYNNGGMTWYDGIKGDQKVSGNYYYVYDEEYCKNGLLKLDKQYTNANNGTINGSVVNFGIEDAYSLRVFPARTVNSGSTNVFTMYFKARWGTTSFSYTKDNKMTSVCFMVYNPFGIAVNTDNSLMQHSYYIMLADANGEDVYYNVDGTTHYAKGTQSFSLGELQPGWNYVEHNLVAAHSPDVPAYITQIATSISYKVSSNLTDALLFDSYLVR